MNISEHLNKNSLHHAYLIEGQREDVVPEIFKFFEKINIKTSGNPDFTYISIDNFKTDEAFELRAMSANKGFSSEKKIFALYANNFSLDAQNVLLKMFEEPIPDTHFFLITPDTNALLKTFTSRFYLISPTPGVGEETNEAERFIAMPGRDRIDFIRNLLAEEENDENENPILDSARSKALKFLNALEFTLYKKMPKTAFDTSYFEHFFKVREFLRMPGSSTKSLMESIALIVPNFSN